MLPVRLRSVCPQEPRYTQFLALRWDGKPALIFMLIEFKVPLQPTVKSIPKSKWSMRQQLKNSMRWKVKDSSTAEEITAMVNETRVNNQNLGLTFFPLQWRIWSILLEDFFPFFFFFLVMPFSIWKHCGVHLKKSNRNPSILKKHHRLKNLVETRKKNQTQNKLHGQPFRDEMLQMSFLINQLVKFYKKIKRITF